MELDEPGKNDASATKMAKNVDGPGKNDSPATKTAKNVDGLDKNDSPATKMAKNVGEKKMPGQSRASWNKTGSLQRLAAYEFAED